MQRGVCDLSTAEYFSPLSFKWDGAPRTEMEFDRHTRTSPPLSIHYTREDALSEQPAPAFPLNINGVVLWIPEKRESLMGGEIT